MKGFVMLKFFKIFFACSLLFVTMVSISETNEQKAIFLCVKNLDSKDLRSSRQVVPPVIPYTDDVCLADGVYQLPEEYNNPESNNFLPYKDVNGDCHTLFRHCFLLYAGFYPPLLINGSTFDLTYIQAYGFGKAKGKAGTFPETIFFGESPAYKKQAVSCVPVLTENEVSKKYLARFKNNSKTAMNHKWADATSAMEEEVKSGYNLIGHNCCTVAGHAIRVIKGNRTVLEQDLKQINFGVGTRFTNIFIASSAVASDLFEILIEGLRELSKTTPQPKEL